MDDYQLKEEDIVNKDYFESIRDTITCMFCLSIFEDPIQCESCHQTFCRECIKKFEKCPSGCKNMSFIPSQFYSELLLGIIIKCNKCQNKIYYKDIKKHMEEDCEMINFKERYLKLKKEYNALKDEIKNPKELCILRHGGSIKTYVHKHPIQVMRHFKSDWTCDICEKSFSDNIPSYNCTLCDFDICCNCAKDRITMGNIDDRIKEFYNDYT